MASFAADPSNLQSFESSRQSERSRRQSFPPTSSASSLYGASLNSPPYSPPLDFSSPFPPSPTARPRVFGTALENQEPLSPRSLDHVASSSMLSLQKQAEVKRDERRRKIAKLQALLGERVPVHLALNDEPGVCLDATSSSARSSSDMARSGSSRLGDMLKGAGEKLGFSAPPRAHPLAAEESFIVVDRSSLDQMPVSQENPQVGTVAGLIKTRKMEQVGLFTLITL